MKALVQRVGSARVEVDGEVIGKIGTGVLILLGVERQDDERGARALARKVAGYRLFSDQQGKMNLNVQHYLKIILIGILILMVSLIIIMTTRIMAL